jgi:hypothetical protein
MSYWLVAVTTQPRCFSWFAKCWPVVRTPRPSCALQEGGGCYVTVASLRWSVLGHLLLPSLYARVVARIVPRHHDVLEVLVLY